MPLMREFENNVINGIWLFAGEGALLQRKSLPQMGNIEDIAINVQISDLGVNA
jgi:hypothetical protein